MLKRISVNNSESDNAGSNIHLPVTCLFKSNKKTHCRLPMREALLDTRASPTRVISFSRRPENSILLFCRHALFLQEMKLMTLQHLQLNDGFLLFDERWSAMLMWIPLIAQFQHHTDYFFPMFSKQFSSWQTDHRR